MLTFRKIFFVPIIIGTMVLGTMDAQKASASKLSNLLFGGKTVYKMMYTPAAGISISFDGRVLRGIVNGSTGYGQYMGPVEIRFDGVPLFFGQKPPYRFSYEVDTVYNQPGYNPVEINDGLRHSIEAVFSIRDARGRENKSINAANTVYFAVTPVTEEQPPQFDPAILEQLARDAKGGDLQSAGPVVPAASVALPPAPAPQPTVCPPVVAQPDVTGIDTSASQGGRIIVGQSVQVGMENGRICLVNGQVGQRIKLVFKDGSGCVVKTVTGRVCSETINLRVIVPGSLEIVYKGYSTPYTIPADYTGGEPIQLR